MQKFKYLNYTFEPYGNIIGKDKETRFHRLTWKTDTARPLLAKKDGYDYEEFYKIAGKNSADVYFVPEKNAYYVPAGGGICRIDFDEMKKYIKVFSSNP